MASVERGAAAPREVVVLATRSAGKIRELRELLATLGVACEDLAASGIAPDPAEDTIEVHATFEENARAKAMYFARLLPGRSVLAEDSGLEVAALGGAPGVRSKRFALDEAARAGEDASSLGGAALDGAALDAANNRALERALRGVEDRRARYRCVAVLVREREWRMASGECTGRILESPRGEGGFGYDPWFFSDELGRAFGEVSAEEKARVSHRARAITRLFDGG